MSLGAGELYTGPNDVYTADRLVRGGDDDPAWEYARLVAFDVPGLEPSEAWPYAARYSLLCRVVAAWNHRVVRLVEGRRFEHLPLQVVRQFPLRRLDELFLAVVHGATWRERQAAGGRPMCVCVYVNAFFPAKKNNLDGRERAGGRERERERGRPHAGLAPFGTPIVPRASS